jgi:hypothetical protein
MRSLFVFAVAVGLVFAWQRARPGAEGPGPAMVQEVEQALVEALDYYADLQFAGGWTDGYSWPGLEGWALLLPKWPATENTVVLAGGLTPHLAMNYLRAYEVLGRTRFLEVARRTGDFLVEAQLPDGRWAGLYRKGTEEAIGKLGNWETGLRSRGNWETGKLGNQPPEPNFLISQFPSATSGPSEMEMIPITAARLSDESFSSAVTVLVWLHRLTHEARYLTAACRAADSLLATQAVCGGWSEGTSSVSRITALGTAEAVSVLVLMQAYTGRVAYRTAARRGAGWLAAAQFDAPTWSWAEHYDVKKAHPLSRTVDLPATTAVLGALLDAYGLTHEKGYAKAAAAALEWLKVNRTRDGWARQYGAATGMPLDEPAGGLLQAAYRARVRAATWHDWGLPALRERYHTEVGSLTGGLVGSTEVGSLVSGLVGSCQNNQSANSRQPTSQPANQPTSASQPTNPPITLAERLRARTPAVRDLLDQRNEAGVWLSETAVGEAITLYDPPTWTLLDYLEMAQALRGRLPFPYTPDMRQRACPVSPV